MQGFIIRVTAYHGEPKLIGNLPTRAGISQDTPLAPGEIVNDFDRQGSIVDLNYASHDVTAAPGGKSDYTVDNLIDDFQEEYGCKVNFGEEIDSLKDGTRVHEFDVFEPSWPEAEEAQDVIDDLTERLRDWAAGYPTGR
jgi:hypothetical protein